MIFGRWMNDSRLHMRLRQRCWPGVNKARALLGCSDGSFYTVTRPTSCNSPRKEYKRQGSAMFKQESVQHLKYSYVREALTIGISMCESGKRWNPTRPHVLTYSDRSGIRVGLSPWDIIDILRLGIHTCKIYYLSVYLLHFREATHRNAHGTGLYNLTNALR